MAQHDLPFAQASAAGRFRIVAPECSPQIQSQGSGEGAAQQKCQGPRREQQMAKRALQGRYVEAADAVDQVKTRAFRRHEAGGETSPNRKPAETDGKQELQQHRHPEWWQGIRAKAVEPTGQIQFSLRPSDPAEADAEADQCRQGKGNHAEFEAGWQRSADDVSHRFLIDQSLPEVSMDQTAQVVEVLIRQSFVQSQPSPHGGLGHRRCAASQHSIHRVSRGYPQQEKYQAGNQPEHQRGQPKACGAVAQQGSGATHQFDTPSSGARISSDSSRWPLPSNRGGTRLF